MAQAAADVGPVNDSHRMVEGPGVGWSTLRASVKRNILIISGAAMLVLIALVILIVVLTVEGGCSFSSGMPRQGEPRAVYSMPDVTNMAKFKGYIHIFDLGFLALDIKRMSVRKNPNTITLEDDCATISMAYGLNTETDQVTIVDLEWALTGAKESSHGRHEKCYLSQPYFYHVYSNRFRYSCLERQVYQCLGNEGVVGELVIDSLELEIGGDDELIYHGQFSKPPFVGSCDN